MSSRVLNPDATLFEAQTRKMTTHTREDKCLATISHTIWQHSKLNFFCAVGSFMSHKNQISESAVRRVLQFFFLTRED